MLSEQSPVAIIGFGVVGRVLALNLLQQYPEISLHIFEKDAGNDDLISSCGYYAGGMVAPICEALDDVDDTFYQQAQSAPKLWGNINKQLDEPVFSQCGTWLVSHAYDMSELSYKSNRLQHLGLMGNSEVKLTGLNPALTMDKALYFDQEGAVNVPVFFKSTYSYVVSMANVKLKTLMDVCQDKLNLLQKAYDYVFDTRGLGAKGSLSQLYGVRGEALIVKAKEVEINTVIRLCHPRYPLYIVPRGEGCYYIGATTVQSQDQSMISVESLQSLLSALTTIHEGFKEARVVQLISQLRPSFPNAMPQVSKINNLIQINGFYRHGYLLSPIICQQVISQLAIGVKHKDEISEEVRSFL